MLHMHLEPAVEPAFDIALGRFELSWLEKVSVDVLISSLRLTIELIVQI